MKVQDFGSSNWKGRVKLTVYSEDEFRQFEADNLLTDSFASMIDGLLRRDVDWVPESISVGIGGNFDQAPPDTAVDTGSRVPALSTDSTMRQPILELPIIEIKSNGPNDLSYVAIARPHQAITAPGETVNELGLLTRNDTLVAHWIAPASGGLSTGAVKSKNEYLVIQWQITSTVTTA